MEMKGGRARDSHITSREKQRRFRSRLRSQGLRPVQIWVPDARAPGFAEECRRQAQRVNRSAGERETLELIEKIADWD
jgi:Protein  of unknown function (DUF3018)